MSNYFKPVDFDAVFPPEAEKQGKKTEVDIAQNKQTELKLAIAAIQQALNSMRTVPNDFSATSIQIDDRTPFCQAFKNFIAQPSLGVGVGLQILARQDFGARFEDFVRKQLQTVYGDGING